MKKRTFMGAIALHTLNGGHSQSLPPGSVVLETLRATSTAKRHAQSVVLATPLTGTHFQLRIK